MLLGKESYDDAHCVRNAAIDRRPTAIARCADANDVVRAVAFARCHGLVIAVRRGGYSFAGKSSCDGSFVIDCSPMKQLAVVAPRARWRRLRARRFRRSDPVARGSYHDGHPAADRHRGADARRRAHATERPDLR